MFGRRPFARVPTEKIEPATTTYVYSHQTSDVADEDTAQQPHDIAARVDGTFARVAHNWWLWELASCLFSIGCIAAIAGVLQRFDGHPLPSWRYGITLNALISLLAVVAKSAMLVVVASGIGQLRWKWFARARNLADFELFDAASRGPGGAAWLLLRTLPTHLVTLAAVIMVAALAFEPFVQQVVSYGQQQVPVPAIEAVALRAQAYDNGLRPETGSGGPQLGPESGMKAAVYQGLFGAVSDGPEPACIAGNCTFPDYTSLAVCSQCVDITEQTTLKSNQSLGTDKTHFVYRYNLTYELPGDVSQSIVYGAYTDLDPPDLSFGPAMASKTDISDEATRELFNVSQPIVAMSMLQFPYVNKKGYDGRYGEGRPEAFECALYFCMQTYRTSVSNGQTTTEVLSSWHDPTLPPIGSGPGTFEVDTSQPQVSNVTLRNPVFAIPEGTITTVSNWLNNTFAGQVLVDISVVSSGTYVNDVLQLFSDVTDISALFANVSTSMSNYIRSVAPADDDSSTVSGTSYRMETFVHVHWDWFMLPVALAVLTTLLLVATIIVTMKRGMQVWKSNSLPVLYHGLAPELRQGEERSITQMTTSADGNVVRLARPGGERGWHLAACEE